MTSNEFRKAIGTFVTHEDAENALLELNDAGFDMNKVSIIAKDTGNKNQISNADIKSPNSLAENNAKAGAKVGAATGGIMGLVGGLGVIALPGVGAIAELGVVLANTLLGGGIGAAGGGLVGALIGWGIPEERAKYYNELISQGRYVVLMEGTEAELSGAEAILKNRRIQDWEIYHTPNTNNEEPYLL